MRAAVLLLALAACDASGSIDILGDTDPGGDTDLGGGGGVTNGGGGGGGGVDTDGGGAADSDPTGGGDTDVVPGDTDPDPFGPDPLAWNGGSELVFVPYSGRSCTLKTEEHGEQVYGAGYLQMERACPTCQRVFTVPTDLTGFCVTSLSSPTTLYRGLEFQGGGRVRVWKLSQSGSRWSAEVLADGTLTGSELTFSYKSSELGYRRVDVTARITLD